MSISPRFSLRYSDGALNDRRKHSPQKPCLPHFRFVEGLGFDRVLIIPPEKHIKFIGGDLGAFKADKTEESRNKLYVAITRARYSLAFVVDDELAGNFAYPVWQSQPCAAAEA